MVGVVGGIPQSLRYIIKCPVPSRTVVHDSAVIQYLKITSELLKGQKNFFRNIFNKLTFTYVTRRYLKWKINQNALAVVSVQQLLDNTNTHTIVYIHVLKPCNPLFFYFGGRPDNLEILHL